MPEQLRYGLNPPGLGLVKIPLRHKDSMPLKNRTLGNSAC